MPDQPSVFISCTRDELRRASEIAGALKRHGTQVMTDWAITSPGGDWIGQLENALADCDVFVPLLSRGFLASEFATYEIGFALHKQYSGSTRIIPVILDDFGESGLSNPLQRFHALDGRGKQGDEIADAVLAELGRVAAA